MNKRLKCPGSRNDAFLESIKRNTADSTSTSGLTTRFRLDLFLFRVGYILFAKIYVLIIILIHDLLAWLALFSSSSCGLECFLGRFLHWRSTLAASWFGRILRLKVVEEASCP